MNITAFLSYVIITSITPGPSNILMMNEAKKFGFKGSWRFNSGILTGFAILGIISGIFTTSLYKWIPFMEPYFKVIGAIYLLYLAWKVSFPKGGKQQFKEVQSSFLSGLIIQLINFKSILFFLTVMSAFILPFNNSLTYILFYLLITIFLGWIALILWSGFGSVFKSILLKYDKSFRLVMGLLLMYSAVSIFL
ncbi:LysE family transporter [Niallia taxi]|uniref:LysE family translocator n=1 Tax=Niallia taxi TaxID=2499688 RepID=UPI0021A29B6E|nr:LysE family transporter [Niallia taxi]MCT2347190.1 LysE family transporter [Niallia taxi]